MRKTVLLSCLCLLLLVSLAAAPVLAATLSSTVTCPLSCSCLLPAEAKKMGYSGYCQGQQKICGYDSQKNEKYCYQKPVTTTAPQLSVTGFKVVTTTPVTVAPQKCASGCTCLSSADGKSKGLLYCNGKQTVCGGTDTAPLYCFALPTTTTKPISLIVTGFQVITTTPASHVYSDNSFGNWSLSPIPCTAPCTCLDPDAARASGLSRCSINATLICGYSTAGKAEYCYTPDRTTGLSSAAGTTITSTLPACPSGCSCLLPSDAAKKGLSYCGGKQIPCSVSSGFTSAGTGTSGQTRYCYTIPAATGSVTNLSRVVAVNRTPAAPIPLPKACPSGCSCLDEKTIRDKGYPYCNGTKTECGFSKSGGVLYCAMTGIAAPEPGTAPGKMKPAQPDNILSTLESLVMSIIGGNQATIVQETSILSTYCQDRYGPDYRLCDGDCVDITRSTENCGGCGNWCNDPAYSGYGHCYNGQCVDEYPGANSCSPGGDIDCPAGAPCLRGVCSALGCLDPGLTDCNNTCLDTRTDTENCGSCGHACLPNQTCTDGRCDTRCGFPGYILCPRYDMPYPGLYCTNTSWNMNHCGRCQHSCAQSQDCRDGVCQNECAPGWTNCGNGGNLRCVNLMTDIYHCGDCESECGVIGNTHYDNETCNSGICTTCPDGGYYCDASNECMDPVTYERTCGECPEGKSICIDLPEFVDLMTDERACGDCHNVCTGGDTCIGGTCRAYGYAGMSVPR